VVIAGVREPGNERTVQLLREYVAQGGQLVIGAGAEFNPARWTELAWLDGEGILPAPLAAQPVGHTASDAVAELKPQFISFESLGSHYYFQLGETSPEQLRDLYSDPLFFKYVEAIVTPESLAALREREAERLSRHWEAVGSDERLRQELTQKGAAGKLDEAGGRELAEVTARLQAQTPMWLRWANHAAGEETPADDAQRAAMLERRINETMPAVRARLVSESGPPLLVERRIGKGNVLLATSGLSTQWSSLPNTDTFFIFDRILRSMIRSTLVERNYAAVERITLPLAAEDRDAQITLHRPNGEEQPLDAGFVGKEQIGAVIQKPLTRGIYRLTAVKLEASAAQGTQTAWQMAIAVNGESAESDLTPLTRGAFEERAAGSELRWVGPAEAISLAGEAISGQNSWRVLLLLVLVLLLAEIALLAWPILRRESAPAAGAL
jgi:hypothetical protein